MSNEERILLSRKNLGRRKQQEFLTGASRALGIELNAESLTSVEEYDAFAAALERDGRQPCVSCVEKELVERRLTALALSEPVESVVLLLTDSEYCGGITIRLRDVVVRWRSLVEYDGGALCLVSQDMRSGLQVYDEEETGASKGWSLFAWGESWMRILDCQQAQGQ